MKHNSIPSGRNISPVTLVVLLVMLAAFVAACGSSNQVQQEQQESSTEADSVAQEKLRAEAEKKQNEQRTKALKAKYREQLRDDYQAQANEITTLYLLAQRRFYRGEYEQALSIVNKALNLRENADLYALRGSIHLGLNNTDQFVENWRTALTMDKNVPLPLTDYVVEQLKKHGLINENLERNF